MNQESTSRPTSSGPMEILPLTGWSQLEVTGADAARFLHNFCTNDLLRMQPQESCETFFCDVKGKILAHTRVCLLEHGWLLLGVPGTASTLAPHLLKYRIDADVHLTDHTSQRQLVLLWGKSLPQQLAQYCHLPEFPGVRTCIEAPTSTGPVVVSGTDLVTAPAVLLSGSAEAVQGWLENIPAELRHAASAERFEFLRIAAGFPWYGRDIDTQDLAQNAARTERAISFTKGCYLGQEPIARLDAMGHTNQELRGLLIEGDTAPLGASVLAEGREVGKITSSAAAEQRPHTLALAKIRTAVAEPGTPLMVQTPTGLHPARVFWPSLDDAAAM